MGRSSYRDTPSGSLHRISSVLLAITLGGVVFLNTKKAVRMIPSDDPNMATAAEQKPQPETPKSATKIWLASPTPAANADRLYTLSLDDKQVKTEPVPPGWRLTALDQTKQDLTLQPSNEGFRLVGNDWDIPLRNKKGAAYQAPILLGVLDEKTAIVSANLDKAMILKVSKTGTIQELKTLDDTTQPLGLSGGLIWLTTFTPGEGIESPPSGPSKLIAVHPDASTVEVGDDKDLITGIVALNEKTYATMHDGDDFNVMAAAQTWAQSGKPLVWINDKTLLFAKGASVFLFDVDQGTAQQVTTLPTIPTAGKIE